MEEQEEERTREGAKPWSKWKIVVSAGVVALASLGSWLWSVRPSEGTLAAESSTKVVSTLHLESFVLNLADPDQRSYLRVGIDLGLGRTPGKSENALPIALVRDTILGVLAQSRVDELLGAKGKEELKADLLRALNQKAPGLEVREVYFTEFLIQR